MKIKDINIFVYKDYTKLLADIFEARKRDNPEFTYRKWAKEIGISSVSALTMVLNGQRNAGRSFQEKLVKNLKLNQKEAEFFSQLVKAKKQAKGNKDLVVFLMNNANENNDLEDKNRPIDFRWQMGFLREASKWSDFEGTKSWLESTSLVQTDSYTLSESLKEMEEKQIIQYCDGAMTINDEYGPKDIDMRYFKHLHNDFLQIAQTSYERPIDTRALEYRMLMIKKSDIPKAKQRLNEFITQFIAEFDQEQSNSKESAIYLTSFYLLPFSK